MQALSLQLADSYIGAFGKLAGHSNTLVVPANAGDTAGMITQALGIFRNVDSASEELGSFPLALLSTLLAVFGFVGEGMKGAGASVVLHRLCVFVVTYTRRKDTRDGEGYTFFPLTLGTIHRGISSLKIFLWWTQEKRLLVCLITSSAEQRASSSTVLEPGNKLLNVQEVWTTCTCIPVCIYVHVCRHTDMSETSTTPPGYPVRAVPKTAVVYHLAISYPVQRTTRMHVYMETPLQTSSVFTWRVEGKRRARKGPGVWAWPHVGRERTRGK